MKLYDVSFRLEMEPIVTVEAKNKAEAKQEALKALEEMDKDEIIERFQNALDAWPEFVVVATTQV